MKNLDPDLPGNSSCFFRVFTFYLLLPVILLTGYATSAQNIAPIINTTWGCKVGNNVYYDWAGTSNVSGGITYYHFNASGRYTQWTNYYALQSAYQCTRFNNTSPANMSCSVNGTIGIRGTFQSSTTYCPFDDEIMVLGMAVLLLLSYAYFQKRQAICN